MLAESNQPLNRKATTRMQSRTRLLVQCVLLLTMTAVGRTQTAVTTNGGSTGSLPVFTGSATIGNSVIKIPTLTYGLGGIYLRTPPNNQNTVVDPRILFEGIASGDGSAATPWGLNLSSVPWVWGQDQMTYHAGFHDFRVNNGNVAEQSIMQINVGGIVFPSGSGAHIIFQDGTTQSTAWNGVLSGGDYAESVNVSGDRERYEPGDVLVIDPSTEGNFLKSYAPYSTAVTGIYSTKPGVVGRRQRTASTHMKEEVPMAMTGIVPTKVSAENGPIKPGTPMA